MHRDLQLDLLRRWLRASRPLTLLALLALLAFEPIASAAPARPRPRPAAAAATPAAATTPAAAGTATATSAVVGPSHAQPRATSCDVIHSLTALDRDQRAHLHQACVKGPGPEMGPGTYAAIFRLVSSSGWHVGVIANILRRHSVASLTAWADGQPHGPPPALVAQERIEAGLARFTSGLLCPELRRSEELAELLDAVGADEPPEDLPFTSEFASCMGVPEAAMEGIRLLTIRADGLEDVTVVMGTRDFVHARRFDRAEALHLEGHRFIVVAVPEASPVAVFANHENLELPVIWRGLMGRHAIVWATPPLRSCLDLSVDMNPGTHLYIDGVRVDGGTRDLVCDGRGEAEATRDRTVDRTVTVTLDRPGTGLPDHEIAALTCGGEGKDRRPVVRHLSPVAATLPSEQLRQAGECEALRLDLSTPARQRVAVLGVNKLPGCEATPLWASDVQERARHILEQDSAHRNERDYANFSAYAEATEALSSLETQIGGDGKGSPDRGADTNALLGSAAQEAWRQGIDTLLSFAVQCTPRGENRDGERQWAYSIRATSIQVSDLFARGYYEREGIDLEDFIDVESVGFTSVDQQDASLGALLDRVFAVDTPRFTPPPVDMHYRRSQPLRISRYFGPEAKGENVPEEVTIGYKAFHRVGRPRSREEREAHHEKGPPRAGKLERPRLCERLVHRGARPPDAIETARAAFDTLPTKEQRLVLQRSRDELDLSSNPRAAVHKGDLRPPRPGWYLIAIKDEKTGEIQDAVCVDATAHFVDLWADVAPSGGPLVFAGNGSRVRFRVRPRVGVTWYPLRGWFGAGFNLGYAFTHYAGARADWKDLEVSTQSALRWRRHSLLLLSPHAEARSRSTAIPVEFRARLGPSVNAGIVNIGEVDDALVEFRRGETSDTLIDFDLDLNLDLSVGAPLGPVQLQGIIMLTYAAVDDSFYRSSTNVTEDANFYIGFGLGVSGGRR